MTCGIVARSPRRDRAGEAVTMSWNKGSPVPPGLLGPVQDRDPAHRVRQRGQQMRNRKRAEQTHLQHADLLAGSPQSRCRRARGLGPRTHEDQHPLGVRVALIVEQSILPAGQRGEALHRAFDDAGHALVERIDRLARLEEGVRILRRAADERMLGVQRARAMGAHQIVVDHRADVGVAEQVQRVQFVRSAESVEEMQERHARFQASPSARSTRNRAPPAPKPNTAARSPVGRAVITSA